MRFSVITPSFQNSEWLKLCVASVADQHVECEHIVQDSCSTDGTGEWLESDPRVRAFFEKDSGMYDAINRGLRRASGDILAYLNCDEQYLPGALSGVETFFRDNPAVEIAFGDALVVDPDGNYLCHRQSSIPSLRHSLVSRNLSILTCATFFRRSVIDRRELFFDSRYKAVGDAAWIISLIRQKVPMALLNGFTSTFTETGSNLCLNPAAQKELRELSNQTGPITRSARPLIIGFYRLRRLLSGHYRPRRFDYEIYTRADSTARKRFHMPKPTYRWVR